MKLTEEHKEKLHAARDAAREARRNAVDAEIADAPRERAAHEHETISGQDRVFSHKVGGAQEDVREAIRDLLREELAQTFPERQPVRTAARESMRPGAVVATGRDGQPLYRKRDQTVDKFDIPDDLKEPGWSYQWCRVSTYGQEDLPHQISLQENGWRFVQAENPKWRGRMMPENYTGAIFRDGLALMERPAILTEEAQREAGRRIKEQSQAQRQQFGMALPQGFTADTPAARQHTFARQQRAEATPDGLRPNLSAAMDIE